MVQQMPKQASAKKSGAKPPQPKTRLCG